MYELFIKLVWLWNEQSPLYKNEYNGTVCNTRAFHRSWISTIGASNCGRSRNADITTPWGGPVGLLYIPDSKRSLLLLNLFDFNRFRLQLRPLKTNLLQFQFQLQLCFLHHTNNLIPGLRKKNNMPFKIMSSTKKIFKNGSNSSSSYFLYIIQITLFQAWAEK